MSNSRHDQVTNRIEKFINSQDVEFGLRIPSELSQLAGTMAPLSYLNSDKIKRETNAAKISVAVSMMVERLRNFPSFDGREMAYESAFGGTKGLNGFISGPVIGSPIQTIFRYGIPRPRGYLDIVNIPNYIVGTVCMTLEFGLKAAASTLTQMGRRSGMNTVQAYEDYKKSSGLGKVAGFLKTAAWGALGIVVGVPMWLAAQPLFLVGNLCSYVSGFVDGVSNVVSTGLSALGRAMGFNTKKYAGVGTCLKAIGKNGIKLAVTACVIAASVYVPVLPAIMGFHPIAAFMPAMASVIPTALAAVVAQAANSGVDYGWEKAERSLWVRFKKWVGFHNTKPSVSIVPDLASTNKASRALGGTKFIQDNLDKAAKQSAWSTSESKATPSSSSLGSSSAMQAREALLQKNDADVTVSLEEVSVNEKVQSRYTPPSPKWISPVAASSEHGFFAAQRPRRRFSIVYAETERKVEADKRRAVIR
jgi:hypothetical protein